MVSVMLVCVATALVRSARPADAEEVVRLAALMYRELGVGDAGNEWADRAADLLRARLGPTVGVVVAEEPVSERLVAVTLGLVEERMPSPANPTGRVGYMHWLFVQVEHRRRGLAHQLSQALLAWFSDAGVGVVDVHASAQAEALFRALGFTGGGPVALRRRNT